MKVTAQMSMSLDGFVTGPDVSAEHPLGIGGERLYEWAYLLAGRRRPHGLPGGAEGPESDALEESSHRTGAYVMGRGMYRAGSSPWGDDPPFHKPVFVLTHTPGEPDVRAGGTTFQFVTDGLHAALARARDAAGVRDVALAGGADVVQQAVLAGVLDELVLHVVPVLLGDGIRLFSRVGHEHIEWETSRVNGDFGVVHLTLRPPTRQTG